MPGEILHDDIHIPYVQVEIDIGAAVEGAHE